MCAEVKGEPDKEEETKDVRPHIPSLIVQHKQCLDAVLEALLWPVGANDVPARRHT